MSKLIKALARNKNIAVYINDTKDIVETARINHSLWPTASAALGRTLSIGSIMGSMLKGVNEKITIIINGGGPIGTIMVDAKPNGNVRGFVGDPQQFYTYNDTGKLAVGLAVGNNGYLKVIKDLDLKENFTGLVELQTGEIGDDFAFYFASSEQIPSIVSLGVLVSTDNTIQASGGLLIQMLPGASEEDILYAEKILSTLKSMTQLLEEYDDIEEIIKSIFDDIEILETSEIYWACECNKDKMKKGLETLEQEELLKIIEEDHKAEIVCQFCGKKYNFDEEELKELIK